MLAQMLFCEINTAKQMLPHRSGADRRDKIRPKERDLLVQET